MIQTSMKGKGSTPVGRTWIFFSLSMPMSLIENIHPDQHCLFNILNNFIHSTEWKTVMFPVFILI